MNKRTSAPARIFAVTALVLAFVIAVVVIAGNVGGDDSSSSGGHHHAAKAKPKKHHEKVPATYEVKSGDTLISIAHETGVPVARIEELNPEVDPQILSTGEQLKLR